MTFEFVFGPKRFFHNWVFWKVTPLKSFEKFFLKGWILKNLGSISQGYTSWQYKWSNKRTKHRMDVLIFQSTCIKDRERELSWTRRRPKDQNASPKHNIQLFHWGSMNDQTYATVGNTGSSTSSWVCDDQLVTNSWHLRKEKSGLYCFEGWKGLVRLISEVQRKRYKGRYKWNQQGSDRFLLDKAANVYKW